MHIQPINSQNNKPTFSAKYVVKGSQKEIESFVIKASDVINFRDCSANLMLNYNPDVILICTDKASKDANWALQKKFKDPIKSYLKFTKYSLDIQLQKIFGNSAKDVKQYNAKKILDSSNFDFFEGVFK